MTRVILFALFPLRYYAYLTAPVRGQASASLTIAEPDMADSLTA